MTKNSLRKSKGNMLILVSVFMSVLGLTLMLGLSFGGVFLAQTLLQNIANEIALSAACVLNGGDPQEQASGINSSDRIGQMNNMMVRSRAAVYESRSNLDTAVGQSNDPEVQALADQLYRSARDGALTMETERRNLKQVVEWEATAEISKQVQKISQFRLLLPWIQLSSPTLATGGSGITFGQIKGIHSNVMQLDDSSDIGTKDRAAGLVHTNKRYKANRNVKLEGADSDIDFKVSSLQPPVKSEVSPARLVLPSAFEQVPTGDGLLGDLPSTVKVTLVMNVETRLGCTTKNQIQVVGVAAGAGGSDMR